MGLWPLIISIIVAVTGGIFIAIGRWTLYSKLDQPLNNDDRTYILRHTNCTGPCMASHKPLGHDECRDLLKLVDFLNTTGWFLFLGGSLASLLFSLCI